MRRSDRGRAHSSRPFRAWSRMLRHILNPAIPIKCTRTRQDLTLRADAAAKFARATTRPTRRRDLEPDATRDRERRRQAEMELRISASLLRRGRQEFDEDLASLDSTLCALARRSQLRRHAARIGQTTTTTRSRSRSGPTEPRSLRLTPVARGQSSATTYHLVGSTGRRPPLGRGSEPAASSTSISTRSSRSSSFRASTTSE